MLKRFSHLFVYLLLAIMPLQAVAAANMLVCNSMMQTESNQQQLETMPCHEEMTSVAADIENPMHGKHQGSCKTNCATLCSSLCAMTALPIDIKSALLPVSDLLVSSTHQTYASITLPSLQRPPILLS